VVQDHYGDVLFRLGRIQEAIDAWTRALGGDAEDLDRNAVDRKIKSARQKLPKK
jgi:predicted negative regulator of RcsB-dependent stress response